MNYWRIYENKRWKSKNKDWIDEEKMHNRWFWKENQSNFNWKCSHGRKFSTQIDFREIEKEAWSWKWSRKEVIHNNQVLSVKMAQLYYSGV